MRSASLFAPVCVALVAAAAPALAAPSPSPSHAAGSGAAPATTPASGPARLALPEALPFIADDYPRALAEARRRKLPLFVDSWAPW